MITTYLFDWDNTLFSTDIYKETYPSIITAIKQKHNITEKEINIKAELEGLRKEERWDSGELSKLFDNMEEYYDILKSNVSTNYLIDDIVSKFKSLKEKGFKIGIVTNSFRKTINLYLETYKLQPDFIFTQDDAGTTKDDPKFWEELIKKEKLNPKECTVMGDSEVDVQLRRPMSSGKGYIYRRGL